MVTVVLDEEMVEVFKNKVTPRMRNSFHNGASVSFKSLAWTLDLDGSVVFGCGRKGTYQYDNEFTEWLKIHRPEVFL